MGTSRRKFILNNSRSAVDYYRYDRFYKFIGMGSAGELVNDITCGLYNIYLTHMVSSPPDKSLQGLLCLKNVQYYFRPNPYNKVILARLVGCQHIKLAGLTSTGALRVVVSVKELSYKPDTPDEYKVAMYQAAYHQVLVNLMTCYDVPRPKSLSKDLLSAITPLQSQGLIFNIGNHIEYPLDYNDIL